MHTAFSFLSWGGVFLLISAHVMVSTGASKRIASRISAAGGAVSMLAAGGMGVWSVFALNLAWTAISLWGSRIPERHTPTRATQALMLALPGACFGLWAFGAQPVAWAASAVYLLAWLAFSLGAITRQTYLGTCILAGIAVVPALWQLGAYAFAFNEAFGVAVGLYGLSRRAWREPRAKHIIA